MQSPDLQTSEIATLLDAARDLASTLELRAVAARAGLNVEFDCVTSERLPAETEHELYRLAQEAVNNVVKHAHARKIGVRLHVAPHTAKLEITDDGIGFVPSCSGAGAFGTASMRQRTAHLGGVQYVESARGSGTLVRVEVPR